jgi:hypothetical protein
VLYLLPMEAQDRGIAGLSGQLAAEGAGEIGDGQSGAAPGGQAGRGRTLRRLGGWPRLLALGLMVLVGLTAAGCKRKKSVRAKPAGVQSVVAMNDAGAAGQLKSGFYGVEGGTWRWTARSFTVELAAPANASTKGARLHLNFTIPDAVIAKLGPLELGARLGSPGAIGLTLEPEHYAAAGSYDYARDVDAGAFQRKGPVTVEFTCDKSIPPTGDDRRELALIAVSVSLESR